MSSHGKVVIVTGACSGIGNALAEDLVSKGWKVAGIDLNEKGQEILAPLGPQAIFLKAHVDNYDEFAQAYQQVFDKWGCIDAVCLNAGIVDQFSLYQMDRKGKSSKALPPKPNLACTDVDFKGVIYGTYLAIHFMRQNPTPGGKIVATSSAWGHDVNVTCPEYSGAKAAVIHFCRTSAPFMKLKDNITMNVVLPGLVKTLLVNQGMRDSYGETYLTPVEKIVAGYNKFLNDSDGSLNGEAAYCAGPDVADIKLLPPLPRVHDIQSERLEQVCDAMFEPVHGQKSDYPGAF